MKIAILCCSHAWGGLEKNILNFSFWLKEVNNQVLLIVTPDSHLARRAASLGIEIYALHNSDKKHLNFKAAINLKKVLQQFNHSNLIIGHYSQLYTAAITKILLFKNPIKLIYLQQMQHNMVKKDPYRALCYKLINVWITPLEYLKQQVLQNTVISEQQIRKLPLCCDIHQFVDVEITQQESRALLNLPKGKFTVGIIGRIDKMKGQEFLIKAAKILQSKGIEINIAIVGNETEGGTGYKVYLEGLTKDLALEANVFFIPYRDDINLVLRSFDVFCMCSTSEPFGMVTVEAMLSGIPVIGTNTGGTPELLEYGESGLLVNPNDEKALAEAIEKFYNSSQLRENIKVRALSHASRNFSHKYWCEQIEQIVDSI